MDTVREQEDKREGSGELFSVEGLAMSFHSKSTFKAEWYKAQKGGEKSFKLNQLHQTRCKSSVTWPCAPF